MSKHLARRIVQVALIFALGLAVGAVGHRKHWFSFRQSSSREDSPSRPGRWYEVRPTLQQEPTGDRSQELKIRQLQALGYASGSSPAPAQSNVTVYDPVLASSGLNLVVSGHGTEALLIDMEGRELHKWSRKLSDTWPSFRLGDSSNDDLFIFENFETFWRRVHLLEMGDLLAIVDGIGLLKIDRDSNLVWARRNGAHHDLDVARDGKIYVLTRRAYVNEDYHPTEPILEDFISVLDPAGNELKKVSLLVALENSPYAPVMRRLERTGDILHPNSIELIQDEQLPFPVGTVLVSIRNADLVCVVDLEKETVIWAESSLWRWQHHPTLLENGNMLVFDNTGLGKVSRVLELNPRTREIVWSYRGTDESPFFTPSCGTSQRLPNGNTLITESDQGRALEVTPDGTIVWEFVSPHRAGERDELIATLFDVVRLDQNVLADWLAVAD